VAPITGRLLGRADAIDATVNYPERYFDFCARCHWAIVAGDNDCREGVLALLLRPDQFMLARRLDLFEIGCNVFGGRQRLWRPGPSRVHHHRVGRKERGCRVEVLIIDGVEIRSNDSFGVAHSVSHTGRRARQRGTRLGASGDQHDKYERGTDSKWPRATAH
jgi:hypothetical protein